MGTPEVAHSERPSVTQRSDMPENQTRVVEGQASSEATENLDTYKPVPMKKKSVVSKKNKARSAVAGSASAQKGSRSQRQTERPKVTHRKDVSVVQEAAVQEGVVEQSKMRSHRFSENTPKKSIASSERPCVKKEKAPQKKKAVVKRSSQGSRERMRESMSSGS